jgi:hypothetical protein
VIVGTLVITAVISLRADPSKRAHA